MRSISDRGHGVEGRAEGKEKRAVPSGHRPAQRSSSPAAHSDRARGNGRSTSKARKHADKEPAAANKRRGNRKCAYLAVALNGEALKARRGGQRLKQVRKICRRQSAPGPPQHQRIKQQLPLLLRLLQ